MRLGLFVLLLAGFAYAQANVRIVPGARSNKEAEIRQTVANYCRLDFDGARVLPNGWDRIKPLTSWRENPEYKRVAVVSRYELQPDMTYDHGRYIFTVQYDVTGEFDSIGGYLPNPDRIIATIEATDNNGDIRVVDVSQPHPFIGWMRFRQYLQSRAASETDPTSKASLQSSIERFDQQTRKTAGR